MVKSFHEKDERQTPTPTTTVTNYSKNSFTNTGVKFIEETLGGQPIYINPAIRDKYY